MIIKKIYRNLSDQSKYLKWYYKHYNRLKKFTNLYKDEDCFIIGNGPSLNQMDLSQLKDHYVFGLNKIYLILEKQFIDFSFLVAVNPLVIEQSKDVYKSMNIPIFLSYQNSKQVNDASNIYKMRTRGNFCFSYSFLDRMSEGYTVTYVAMQIAFLMGFKNIFLIGVDHNFQQSGNPNSKQVMQTDDPNHFHPDYFKGQQWHLADVEGNEISYRVAKKLFKDNNRKIYNATLGGKLEIFERISFNKALGIAKKKSNKK